MRILVVGSGGREHALIWKIKQSKKTKHIFVAPGNPGMEDIATIINLKEIDDIVKWAKMNKIDLVVCSQDNYLANGIVDKMKKAGVKIFGPSRKASKIEWSKVFSKNFMKKHNIPTASFATFNNFAKAKKYLDYQKYPIVIKADGLAYGKGVIICEDLKEANQALERIFEKKVFGNSGNKVVIEEYIQGREVSIHAFSDGKNVSMFPVSKDHKKIFEGNNGPNTGGIGTVMPIALSEKELEEIKVKVIMPVIKGMRKLGTPFVGVLYPGIFLTKTGPKVIEYNARFGDPETEVYVRTLKTDLVDIMLSCINGCLNRQKIVWSKEAACCIVCCSMGYPGTHETGKEIKGIEKIKEKDIVVFHFATKKMGNKLLTNGGRVLGITATAKTLKEALGKSYKAINKIKFEGMYYRRDINF